MLKVDHVWLILRDYHFLIGVTPTEIFVIPGEARDDKVFNLIGEYVPILLLLDAKN